MVIFYVWAFAKLTSKIITILELNKNYPSDWSSSHEFPEEDNQSRSRKFEQVDASPCSQ